MNAPLPDAPSSSLPPPRPAARLHGVRVACFYPWTPFEPTGAWSRFSCLWKYLLAEGAEVTLALLEQGHDTRLQNLAIRYLGEHTAISDAAAFAQTVTSAQAMPEFKGYSSTELYFLLRYEKSLYLDHPKVGPWLDAVLQDQDLVTCEYPMYAPLLADRCRPRGQPLIVTSHDMLFELHGAHPKAREHLKQKELHALALADAVVFCNAREQAAFGASGLTGVTVLNTGDVRAIRPGNEDASRESLRAGLKIKTAHYCLFVGSHHGPNLEAAIELRRLAKRMPEMTFVVAGNCHANGADGNFLALGRVPEPVLDLLYRGAFAVLVPLVRGTGMSVKIFEAFSYAKPVISTPVGARGHAVTDGQELLILATPADFPLGIRRLLGDAGLRRRIAQAARAYALPLDYRTHFQPYGDLICRLLQRPAGTGEPARPSLCLVDNNLSNRVGHHFNYAWVLQAQCRAERTGFVALVSAEAPGEVRQALSAHGLFSQGVHEEFRLNPYPEEWGNIRATYDFLRSNDLFLQELAAGLAGRARSGDTVFLPNATPRQLLALALLLSRYPLYRTLRFVLVLRYSCYTPSGPLAQRNLLLDKGTAERYGMALEKLQQADPGGAVRLATDSQELAAEYQPYFRRAIEVLPIPHTLCHAPGDLPADLPAKSPGKIRIVFLGDARDEKGFEFLPAVVRACADGTGPSAVEFVFQAFISSPHHQRMARTIDELSQLESSQVHLVRRSLLPDEYQTLLSSADLVLLPYDAATYRARTSGPFVEAICADKPVVIPQQTWMCTQLGDSRAGQTFLPGDVPDLIRATRALLADLAGHTAAAGRLGRQFREHHNPQNFLRHLMPDELGPDPR